MVIDETPANITVPSSEAVKEESKSDLIGTLYTQSGPYGELSITLPDRWDAECVGIDSEQSVGGLYGFILRKSECPDSQVTLSYYEPFGVCGTGLVEKEITIAGCKACAGYYDGYDYWNFIYYKGACEGVVAVSGIAEKDEELYEEVLTILDTVKLDRDKKSGGVYYFEQESEVVEIGLQMSLTKITASGAEIKFTQWDPDASTGNLEYGSEYTIEKYQEATDQWEALKPIIENYAWTSEAYEIKADAESNADVNWESLYGELEPGTYRLTKTIIDFRDTGDYDEYEIKSGFIWAGNITDEGDANINTYTSITMAEAQKIFETKGNYIILDVRRPDEYANGHIPGAINVANETIVDTEPSELPDKDQVIYVHCRSGVRSKQASAKLSAMGYTNIIEFGGIIDWPGEVVK